MKKFKIIFVMICIISILVLLTGCTKEKERKNTSEEEAYSETIKLMYEGEDKKAYDLISKYKDSEDRNIQYLLGNMYYDGRGVDAEQLTAVNYYKKSADQGYDKAQYMLGRCYQNGYGVVVNKKQALEWYKKAAEQGNVYALKEIAWLYIYDKDGIEKDYAEALRIGKLLLEKENSAEGQFIIGYLYDYGYGVQKNDEIAFSWYLKSAEQGNRICQFNVGKFYTEGIAIQQNKELGKQWLEKSALKGYKHALEYLLENY